MEVLMPDRDDDRYRGDPYSSGRGFARDDRNILERAGDEVRAWFGRDEAERRRRMEEHDRDRYRSTQAFGYEGQRDPYRERSDYGPARSSERDWTPDRWEHTDRWSGERPSDYGRAASPYRAWHERDDRFVAPGDYRDWTRQGWSGRDAGRSTEPRGIYEDDRGRTHLFEHGSESFAGRGPKGYRRSDERIREDVCDRLTEDGRVDATDVEVLVNSGEVTLSGAVTSRGQKRYAEDIVEDVTGVREVHNNLRVSR
jgi:osmotically-inducible protein OsmY